MNKKRVKQSVYKIVESKNKHVIKDPTFCPNCGIDASGFSEISEKFGLRNMSDGITRVQSWCKDCRNYRFSNKFN
jgi:hypothetical protein